MEIEFKKNISLMLLGLTGSGKSRLGNKLLEEIKFKESDDVESCTKNIQREESKSGIEVIDTQGFFDTNKKDDKNGLISIFEAIRDKVHRPNLLVYVQKANDYRFTDSSKKAIEQICQIFNTKSIWKQFIVVFTYGNCISKKKRDELARKFINKILNTLKDSYVYNQAEGSLISKIDYYFVELNSDDEINLEQETINNLRDIKEKAKNFPPICDIGINGKILVEIKIERGFESSISKSTRKVIDEYGKLKYFGAYLVGSTPGCLGTSYASPFVSGAALSALGASTIPIVGVGALTFLATSFLTTQVHNMLEEGETFKYKEDENYLNEHYKTFDKKIYVYSDGTERVEEINVQYKTRVVPR